MAFRSIARHLEENGSALARQVSQAGLSLFDPADLGPLMDLIGDSRYVLLGEATHGTAEFYMWRSFISQQLIREKGFSFICVEGDWPDCYRVNRYAKSYPDSGADAYEVLVDFNRWPTWMWANWEIVALVEWMRRYNDGRPDKVGFYGLDVYSLWESMESIIAYLEKYDPEAAKTAKKASSCFEPYGQNAEQYAWKVAMVPESCEREVIDLLVELRHNPRRYERDDEDAFSAEQNALVMVDAERYYRTMVRGGAASWNVRDKHMFDTLIRLMQFHGPGSKAIVWAHNTHIGDARATDMVQAGEFNIGQLVREHHSGDGVVLVGFATNRGTVVAADEWGAPMEDMMVPPGAPGSWEDVLHQAGNQDKLLILRDKAENPQWTEARGQRAIGVVYNPAFERYGNYVPTSLPRRYDALLYIDESHSLHQLHVVPQINVPPELYPWGI